MRTGAFALLLAVALTACSAQPAPSAPPTSSVSAETPAPTPAANWWEGLTVEDLPDAVTPAEEVQAGSGTLYLLSELPEEDIALYGYGSDALTGVLLRRGEVLSHWEEPYLAVENPAAPELWWDDFDGDGEKELAVQYLTENTVQRRQVQFHLYTPTESGWADLALDLDAQAEALLADMSCSFDPDSGMVQVSSGSLSTSAYLEEVAEPLSDSPLTAGESVFFRRSGSHITAVLPLGLARTGQDPLLFASALCAVVPRDGGLTLELEGLETLYGV